MVIESVLPFPAFRPALPSSALPSSALPCTAPRARRLTGRVARWVVLAAVVGYLVVPQITGAGSSWQLLVGVDLTWLLVAVGLEAASLAVYAALTRAMLPRLERPSYRTVLGIDLATLAASHVVPGGSAVGLGLGYRLLTRAGVSGPAAVFAKATQSIGSAVVLNLLLWGALVASLPLHGFSPVYGPVALTGLVLLSAAAVLLGLLLRGDDRIATWLARQVARLPRVSGEGVRAAVLTGTGHLRVFAADRRLLATTGLLAAANWLLDAAALWACVRAFGHSLGPDGLLVSYGIAAVLAALPVTPAGLGVVEAFLIPSLVAFSVPHGVAVLGVLAWRALSFLLPVPIGGVSYLLLQTHSRSTAGHATELSSVGDAGRPPLPRSSVPDDELQLSGCPRAVVGAA
ncbi:hypothetical protein SAMN05661080_01672 [Modestobacter sp. DSM 44400]|uniref:lysylphosphatidylglycerol synthase transmembrane domain-containing protein n=1 Tax=Modestobacter sp. DSM 44400 TaxID=1550230 RepID=UPI00089BA811|nr:YbhN family protein [Modestobacter sp. DSM 44400]SDX90966.1 hypothetical protein SAMN05661080_01672 [Modestobacter sp. DSM 44400]